ncbi:MAG TPA: C4-type zinc ribbon domain-containing protein [Terrimicrobiaceae bacterium]|nr:C4-type zinc ribbon domain-containing protein [Terrimicrobiaceae bacterium]
MICQMLDVIEKLLTLQDRDQRLRSFQTEITHLPEERKAREKQLADSASRLEKAKSRAKVIEIERRNLEIDAGVKREAISRYKQQQLQTRRNEEYSALAHEIEAAEKTVTALEDRELDLMEEIETLNPQIVAAEKAHAEERQKIEHLLAGLESRKSNLEARITELKSEHDRLAQLLDESVRDIYLHLFKTKHGLAVATLEHEVCMGCHMKVTAQTGVQVRAARSIVHCPQCGRILYMPA